MSPLNPIRPEIVGSTVLIAGFGREGQSVYRYLRQVLPQLTLAVADQNTELSIDPQVTRDEKWGETRKYFGTLAWESVSQYETVIRSPGITPETLYASGAKHITSATNLFFAAQPGQVIGVTGTKGKSTTSSLIAHLLKTTYEDVRLVGNIGIPVLDYLEGATTETLFVMELSSYQLADCRYSPHVAVVLDIVPEHLNYHGDFAAYFAAKANIVRFQKSTDHIVFSAASPTASQIATNSPARSHVFSQHNVAQFVDRAQLVGPGNRENIAAAITAAKVLSVSDEAIAQAVPRFEPLPHRLEPVGVFQGIYFVNDSLSTTPQATINAIESLTPAVHTLIVGGFDRGVSYEPLQKYLIQTKPSVAVVIGLPQTGHRLIETLGQHSTSLTLLAVDTLEEAVTLAVQHTPAGATCVLSPAAASFNQYRDYAERGEAFRKLVQLAE